MKKSILLLILIATIFSCKTEKKVEVLQKPNILFIMTDDHA